MDSYVHNALSLISLPILPTALLAANPIFKTALEFRRGTKEGQTKEYVRDCVIYMKSIKSLLIKTLRNRDLFVFTNQTAASLSFSFNNCITKSTEKEPIRPIGNFVRSAEMVQNFMEITSIYSKDGAIGNYYIKGKMRQARWMSIEKEVKRLSEAV